MAEEHGCQAPEGHRLCVNKCGLFGSPTTMDLCSKCFREQESTKSTVETSLSSSATITITVTATTTVPSPSPSTSSQPPQSITTKISAPLPAELALTVTTNLRAKVQSNRCAECGKRVGLIGFKCRCGVTFCGTHRYPEKHTCSFDFKTVGREEIARANPVIRAEKLEKI